MRQKSTIVIQVGGNLSSQQSLRPGLCCLLKQSPLRETLLGQKYSSQMHFASYCTRPLLGGVNICLLKDQHSQCKKNKC